MEYFKLQLACLLIVLCVAVIYAKNTARRELPCNRYFNLILYVAPWFIVFDGMSAYTVNHLDCFAPWINLLVHGLFFLFAQLTIVATFLYLCDTSVGLPKGRLKKSILFLPFIISEIVGLVFLKNIEYVHGVSTNYSIGVAPTTCFVSLFIYFSMVFFILVAHKRKVEKRKYVSILIFLVASLLVVIGQTIYPEALITSMVAAILVLGIYAVQEDPAYRQLEFHNSEMTSGFATLVENRDNSTGGHIRRTKEYVRMMLSEMQKMPKYNAVLSRDFVKNMINAAPLHDIGKISTPDCILQKPAKLTDDEYGVMKLHAATGGEIIKDTFKCASDVEFLEVAYQVARHHHEKWNGRGYPDGLAGERIPLCSRIMAVADVFDAVSAKRCYRDAMPIETCFQIIENGSGSDFDPELVKIFMNAKEKVLEIYHRTFE